MSARDVNQFADAWKIITLDNRRNDILLWINTGYTFLKRQSQQDPRAWIALTNGAPKSVKTTAGNN